MTLVLRYSARSDRGLVRQNNQDAVYAGPRLLALADGMGGHAAGEVASSLVISALAPLDDDVPLSSADFDRLLALREQVAKVLEPMRASGAIGAALEAEVTVACGPGADLARLAPLADELRFLLISGDVVVQPGEGPGLHVTAVPTTKPKCIRCWQYRADVGSVAAHPQICGRCVDNLDGDGEDRQWF